MCIVRPSIPSANGVGRVVGGAGNTPLPPPYLRRFLNWPKRIFSNPKVGDKLFFFKLIQKWFIKATKMWFVLTILHSKQQKLDHP